MDIETTKAQYEDQLMSLPNVTAVGIGERQGKAVIKVFVTCKLAEAELRPEDIVPKALESFETDVEEIGVVTVQTVE